jgi:hypothetical protein
MSHSLFSIDAGGTRFNRFHESKIAPKSLPTKQELTMLTALPISYSAEIVVPPKPTGSLRPVWLIVIWALVMLLMGAFANPDAETGPADPLQLLMVF